MDVFTFAFLCVVIGCSIPLSKVWLNRKPAEVDSEALDGIYAEVERLRERVETLEKIVTDEQYQLKQELRALGD